jgi:hypothetical protein
VNNGGVFKGGKEDRIAKISELFTLSGTKNHSMMIGLRQSSDIC